MLNEKEIQEYFKKHQISIAVQQYIQIVRNSDPARLVGSPSGNNVAGGFSSKKMGHSGQTDSRTAEYPYAVEFEYDDSVLEFWDQPQPITINRTDKNGKVRPGSYTPDFLLLTVTGPLIVEVKTEENLSKLVNKHPQDWVRTNDGVTNKPAKEAFHQLGLPFKVCSTSDISLIRTENLKLLLSSRNEHKAWNADFHQSVMKKMAKQSWVRISDLAKQLRIIALTPLIQMIDEKVLFAPLNDELLTEPESTWVSTSHELAELGFQTRHRNDKVCDDSPISLDIIPTEKQALRALNILKRIKSGEKSRSIRRWRKRIEEGEANGLTPFQSLLPKYHQSGNRKPRLNKICTDFIDKFIKEHHSTPLRLMPGASYNRYFVLAKESHPLFPPVSRPTFRKYIAKADQQKIARGRGGKRAANAAANPTDVKDRGFLATAPFELASLDHHLVKQKCIIVTSSGKTYTAQPWLTAMVDVYSKDVLAAWLSFRTPSKRACGMIMRICARNHGRLPKAIIVDGGSDFQSVYFDSLLAHFGIDPVNRPKGHARYGSEIERFFLLYKTQWSALRPGNTVAYKEGRAVSGTHNPDKTARLTIEDSWSEILQYIEWRNDVIIGNEKISPQCKLVSALEKFPFVGVQVEYSSDFELQTAVDSGFYSVDPYRGIYIDGTHYWSPELAIHSPFKKQVEVRHEPENPYKIYAQISDQWVTCTATENNTFQLKDPVIRLAEAARVLDCRTIRDAAKIEASQSLAKKVLEIDEQHKSKNKNHTHTQNQPTQKKVQKPISIFEHLKDVPVKQINAKKWGE